MRLDTAAAYSTRHADLLAEADAARLAGATSFGLGTLFRKAGMQLASTISATRSARVVSTGVVAAPAKSAARS